MKISKSVLLVIGFFFVFFSNTLVLAAPKSKMIGFWNDSEEASKLSSDHSRWQEILERYVDDNHSSRINRFDYDQVTDSDRQLLDQYLENLQSMDPRQFNLLNQKAYWLNLYNAKVVSMALESKPEKSIRSIGNIWKKKRLNVTLQAMSLDDIEHGVIRPIFRDPRIHFGLTPATIGSGDILAVAYTGENVEQLLEQNTKDFFNRSTKGFYIEGNKLVVSSIFKWYKDDFGGSSSGIKAFIKKYVDQERSNQIDQTTKIGYQYDWSMNKP